MNEQANGLSLEASLFGLCVNGTTRWVALLQLTAEPDRLP